MKFTIKILFMFLVSAVSLYGQSVSEQWVKRYNGNANSYDGATAITTDVQGNIYVTGSSFAIGVNRDYLTIKYNQLGDTLWVRRFNGTVNGGDYSFAIAVDNSGNVYVTGRSDRGAPTNSDYTTIKYNSLGSQQWVSYYNGPGNTTDEARSIAVDNSGNVYVTGKSQGTGQSGYGYDIATIKYDANGNQSWAARYNGGGNGDDLGYSIALDANTGDVYVCGNSLEATGSFATLIKYNSDGAQQWVRTDNGTGNSGGGFNTVRVGANGFVYVGGTSWNNISFYDYLTMKYNSSGVLQWYRRFNGSQGLGDFETAMKIDGNGNVYVTGECVGSPTVNDSSFATIKYNSNGDLQWVSIFPGSFNSTNVARDIGVDNMGNVIVTGSSKFNSLDHYVTLGYSSGGSLLWNMFYNASNGAGNDFSSALAIDNNQNVYVTGSSYGMGTDYDFATLKYSIVTGIDPSNNKPLSYSLSQNFPNPFNPATTISFEIPSAGQVKLSVYDVEGKEVAVLINDYLVANKYNINWNAEKVTSGVYFYKLQTNEFTSTKKMILIK